MNSEKKHFFSFPKEMAPYRNDETTAALSSGVPIILCKQIVAGGSYLWSRRLQTKVDIVAH